MCLVVHLQQCVPMKIVTTDASTYMPPSPSLVSAGSSNEAAASDAGDDNEETPAPPTRHSASRTSRTAMHPDDDSDDDQVTRRPVPGSSADHIHPARASAIRDAAAAASNRRFNPGLEHVHQQNDRASAATAAFTREITTFFTARSEFDDYAGFNADAGKLLCAVGFVRQASMLTLLLLTI